MIKKQWVKLSSKVRAGSYRISKWFLPQTKQGKMMKLYFEDPGSETRLLEYDLNEQSVVFDLGGYKGQWTKDIFCRYGCQVFVFEPVPEFYEDIKKVFHRNPKIRVFNFGLGRENQTLALTLGEDGSSLFTAKGPRIDITLRRASEFLQENQINKIDLLEINIEGGEYDLLDHLIEADLVERISNILVQFHNYIPEAEIRMNKIRQKLMETHVATFQYDFIWENWRRKAP